MSPSKNGHGRVLVIDENGAYLVPTSSANARRLLKSNQAKIEIIKPFTIRLTKTVLNPNIQRRQEKMQINLHEFFAEPHPVYVQNISNPIGVISLEFRTKTGQAIPFRVPANRNPIRLTDKVPFDVIKDCINFLDFLNPSAYGPAKLQLLTEEEYDGYYTSMQKLTEINAKQLAAEAQEKALQVQNAYASLEQKIVPSTVTKPVEYTIEPQVSPKVISTCQLLNPDTNENPTPMGAREALDILNSLSLTMIDYDYIMGHTYEHVKKENGMIKKWAMQRQQVQGTDRGVINSKLEESMKKKRGRKPKEASETQKV